MSGITIGIAFGLVASFGWAFANVYIQRSARAMGSLRSMFWGQLVGALFLAPFFLLWPIGQAPVPLSWLAVGGAASALAYYSMFRAFGGGPVSVVSPIVSGWSVVSCLLGVLLFHETVGPLRALGIALVVGGMGAIAALNPKEGGKGAWKEPRLRVLAWALASCVGFGVMVVSFRPLGRALGPVGALLGVWGAQWFFLLPVIYSRRGGHLLPPAATDFATWRLVIAVGGFEVLGFLGLESGIRHAPIVVVSPVASTSALVTVLTGYFWLEEDVPLRSLLFAVVVVSGIVCVGVG